MMNMKKKEESQAAEDKIVRGTQDESRRKALLFASVGAILILLAALIGIMVYNSEANRLQRYLDLGQKYLDELDYEQAIVEFERAISIDPKCTDAYLSMAAAYESMGNDPAAALTPEEGYAKSMEVYDRLLELDGGDEQVSGSVSDSLRKYIDILMAEKRYEEVRTLVEKYRDHTVNLDFQLILEELEKKESSDAGAAESANAEQIQVDIVEMDIKADNVFNTGGYGSLVIQGTGSWWDPSDTGAVAPQSALVDNKGSFVFSYQSTYLNYRVSDGIVSLTEDYPNITSKGYNGAPPAYYRLDGSSVLDLESGAGRIDEQTSEIIGEWYGGPMLDGYALLNKFGAYVPAGSGVGSSGNFGVSLPHSYIVDKNGTITCTLPEEFNLEDGIWGGDFGESGYNTSYSLGWCGEGLFAVYHVFYENGKYVLETEGYMDAAGNMTIDLAGKGFANCWPFHGGFAAVQSEGGMFGFIDKTGTLVIPCAYDDFSTGFSEDGICAVAKDGKWGYIDRENNVVIPFEYDGAYGADGGMASVVKDGKCGLVDYSNRIIVPLEYDEISSCEEEVAYAIKDGILYIISK